MRFHLLQFISMLLAVSILLSGAHALAAGNSGITYQGRILKPNGDPLSGTNVQFKMQIRSPGAESCMLFEEMQTQDLSDSGGNFSVTINDGGVRTDTLGLSIDRVFSNRRIFDFSALPISPCASGDDYTPNFADGRVLVVSFKDETMPGWEQMPEQKINFVPLAIEAKQVSGFRATSLVRVQEADGTLGNLTPLSNANYTELLALIGGTTTQYEKPGKLGGISLPVMGATPGKVLGWDGSAWTAADPLASVQAFAKTALPACAGGAYLRNNSGTLECTTPAVGGGGTVTEVRTGTGLTGGPINSDGDIALATLNAGGTGFKVTYDVYGRVTAAVALVEADIPQLSAAGKVVGSAITSGTIGGSTSLNTTGTINSGAITSTGLVSSSSGSFTALGTQSLQVFKTTNDFKVSVIANPAMSADYALTLPSSAGTLGQVLTTNGTGGLSWSNAASGSVTSLTGDVTSTGTGAVATTIAANAVNSGKIADGSVATADLADDNVTFAKIQNVPTATLAGRYTAGSGDLESLTLGTGLALSAGGVLSSNIVDTDTDTFAAVTAACGNGTVPLKAGGVWTCSTPTPLATASAIVQRDGTGNFAANVITMNGAALNNAGSIVNLVNLAGSAYTLTMPVALGTNGQVLGTSGSGQLVWSTPSVATGDFKADGSVPMTGNLQLNGKYLSGDGGSEGLAVDASGNVGVGTLTPSGILDVRGGTAASGNGTDVSIYAQNGGASGNTNGGNIVLMPGSPNASGANGRLGIGTATPNSILDINASSGTVYTPSSTSVNVPSGVATMALANVNGVNGSAAYLQLGARNSSSTMNYAYLGAVATSGSASPSIVIGQRTGAPGYDERMRIDPTGKVGIGTTGPVAKLDVAGSIRIGADASLACNGTSTGSIRLDSTVLEYCDGTSWAALGSGGTPGAAAEFAAGSFGSPGLAITGDTNTGLYAPAADTLSIAAGGVEGLRVNTVASGVNYVAVTPSATGNPVAIKAAGADANVALSLAGKGTGGVVIPTGKLGVGTSAPNADLQILSATVPIFRMSSSAAAHGMTTLYAADTVYEVQALGANGAEVNGVSSAASAPGLTLNASIGVASPTATTPAFKIHTAKKNGTTWQSLANNETAFQLSNRTTPLMTVLGSGNVGIGTVAPLFAAHIASTTNNPGIFVSRANDAHTSAVGFGGSTLSGATPRWSVGMLPGIADFQVQSYDGTTGTSPLYIKVGGNVGIGTTTPTSKLEVAGSIRSVASTGASATNGTTTIDWSLSNNQTMTVACTATTFTNMADGATYNLAVMETSATQCIFTHAALTFYFSPANGVRLNGLPTLYSFTRIGTNVFVSWAVMNP